MLAAIALALGLGVGASDSNTIIVRIDGKETPVTLAGVSAGSERGKAFANCLVAGRVVRVKGPRTAATATMLDDRSVAAHVNEFLETTTGADPCKIGRAAYQAPPLPATAPAATAVNPGKKPVREVHVAFSSGKLTNESVNVPRPPATTNEYGLGYSPAAAAPRKPIDQPTYNTPSTLQAPNYQPIQAPTYTTLPSAGTSPGFPQAQTQSSLQQQNAQPTLQQPPPAPMPTTTYAPQPPR